MTRSSAQVTIGSSSASTEKEETKRISVATFIYHTPEEILRLKQAGGSKFITRKLTLEEAARLYDRFYYDIDLSFITKLSIADEYRDTDEITLSALIVNQYARSRQRPIQTNSQENL